MRQPFTSPPPAPSGDPRTSSLYPPFTCEHVHGTRGACHERAHDASWTHDGARRHRLHVPLLVAAPAVVRLAAVAARPQLHLREPAARHDAELDALAAALVPVRAGRLRPKCYHQRNRKLVAGGTRPEACASSVPAAISEAAILSPGSGLAKRKRCTALSASHGSNSSAAPAPRNPCHARLSLEIGPRWPQIARGDRLSSSVFKLERRREQAGGDEPSLMSPAVTCGISTSTVFET